MTLYPKAVIHPLRSIALALGLAALAISLAAALFLPDPARAQTDTSTITISTSQTSVYEGGLATFKLTRHGGRTTLLTVPVKTWEPDYEDSSGNNLTERTREVTFARGHRTATLGVMAYIDQVVEATDGELRAQVQPSGDGSYQVGDPDLATIGVMNTSSAFPAGQAGVTLVPAGLTLTEGDTASFNVFRSGDTTRALTVQVEVDDPSGFLRGDHQDSHPEIPGQVEVPAGKTSVPLTLQIPDDARDIPSGSFNVSLPPSNDYLLRNASPGAQVSRTVEVSDNDAAQELELHFGKDGTNGAAVFEGNYEDLEFIVKRRQQDANAGQTARFTVRLETDRSGDDWRLEDWTEDTGTGRLYKDFPLEITGTDLEVKGKLDVTFNGESEPNWDYWASIKPLEDHSGTALTSSQESEYWTVKSGFRETTVNASDGGNSSGSISIDSDVTTVTEGQAVVFTLTRIEGPMSKPVTVRVETSEANRESGGTNPSTEYHNVTIEAWRDTPNSPSIPTWTGSPRLAPINL